MKKILAVLIALMMITACAAEDNSGMQSSAADGSGSSASGYSEENSEASGESSSQTSHSSQQSGDPAFSGSESSSEKTSSGSGVYSETSSSPELSSGSSVISVPPAEQISPIVPDGQNGSAEAMENSYVKRVSTLSSNYIIWYHAVNEKVIDTDRPVVLLTNMDELNSFLMDMDGLYFQDYKEDSAGVILKGYDEKFFEENVIILTHIQSNSGSVRYTLTGIDVSGNSCTMNINTKMPEIGTTDMADWFIFAEYPKDAVAGCENYKVNIGF
ncbi:MAG: hypothetical protein IJ306_02915 [Oscillospiraceae bacterium]|nr:hypothetical protein [Oscillospiraceae bacterium]